MDSVHSLEMSRCPICRSDARDATLSIPDIRTRTGNWQVIVCPACDVGYVSPRPTREGIGVYYPDGYYTHRSFPTVADNIKIACLSRQCGFTPKVTRPHQRTAQWAAALLAHTRIPGLPDLSDPGSLLDVGCGSGSTMQLLELFGWRTEGVDTDPIAVCMGREQGMKIELGDIDVYADGQRFDVIRFWHSLEHVHDPVRTLRRARRLLNPQGYLIVGVPNRSSLSRRLFARFWHQWDVPRHLYHFSPAGLRGVLQYSGLWVESQTTYSDRGMLNSLSLLLASKLGSLPRIHSLLLRMQDSFLAAAISLPLDRLTEGGQWGDSLEVRARPSTVAESRDAREGYE